MIVLAMDTTHELGSLALSYGDETLEEVSLHAPEGYSGILFAEIDKLVKGNSFSLDDVDIYAAAAGPGSFTGVRIGLTAVKALASARSKPCFGISNLAAMANFGTEACRAVILDARKGEIYGGVFGSHPQPETVAPLVKWLAALPAKTAEFLSFDFAPFDAEIAASRFAHASRTVLPRAIAASIAELALGRFRAGDPGDPAPIDANYVRRSDAELLWKEHL